MRIDGGCHCGFITFEAETDSTDAALCHCTDCQKLTGTAFRVNISAQPETFKLKSGMPKNYVRTAESGNKCAHAFCQADAADDGPAAVEDYRLWQVLPVGWSKLFSQIIPQL